LSRKQDIKLWLKKLDTEMSIMGVVKGKKMRKQV
jgi:hypothetical protein